MQGIVRECACPNHEQFVARRSDQIFKDRSCQQRSRRWKRRYAFPYNLAPQSAMLYMRWISDDDPQLQRACGLIRSLASLSTAGANMDEFIAQLDYILLGEKE